MCGADAVRALLRHLRARNGRRSCSGVALVAVMWIVAALSLLAMGLVASSRSEVRSAQTARAFAEAAALGDAAIQLAARDLRFAPEPIDRRSSFEYSMSGRKVIVHVSSASGFIDLNAAPETLLRDLFVVGAGVSVDVAEQLAQRVVDWRDADESVLPLGAENADYAAAGVPFRTRGGAFDVPEDLLQVLGVGFDVYDRIQTFITTVSGSAGVDPLAAPLGVLRILAGGRDDVARAFVAVRDSRGSAADMTAFVQEHMLSSASTIYHLEALYPADAGHMLARVRWIDLGSPGAGGLPWRTLRIEPVRAVVLESGDGA